MIKPFYDDGVCVIYHGDCREILPSLPAPDLLLTDPPYGIGYTSGASRSVLATAQKPKPIHGDQEAFDPRHLLYCPRTVLFGAHNYAQHLPPSTGWIVWDKLAGLVSSREVGFNDTGDAELAWTNLGGPIRVFSHRWMGMLKDSERDERRVHPTQKPLALMAWIIGRYTEPGQLVIDPYAGSGTALRAAKDLGRKAIGIEIEEQYCEIAAKRLSQEVFDWNEAI